MGFWVAAGMLGALASQRNALLRAPTVRARAHTRPPGAGSDQGVRAAPGAIALRWSAGGESLGVVAGAIASALVFAFVLHGVQPLPDTLPATILLVLVTWLGGMALAADSGEGSFAAGATTLLVGGAYVVIRAATLYFTSNAAALFEATPWWFVVLALLMGYRLRAPSKRKPLLAGRAAMLYPIAGVLAVVFVFVRGVRPVQADIYFQTAAANFSAALATDDRNAFAKAEALFNLAVPPGASAGGPLRALTYLPATPTYYMKWAEYYTQVGAAVMASAQPDMSAAAVAFDRAQELLLKAEELEPLMPYHVFNRGHLQLVFAQGLPPGQRDAVAANAAQALSAAFDDLKHDPQVANEYALARLLEGNAEQAIYLLEYSLDLDPERTDTLVELGRAYSAAGRFEDARTTLERALATGAGGTELLVALGDVAREQEELDTAIDYYARAAAGDPSNWAVLFNLGLMHGEAGDAEQALDTLMRALQIAPPSEAERIENAIDDLVAAGSAVRPLPVVRPTP